MTKTKDESDEDEVFVDTQEQHQSEQPVHEPQQPEELGIEQQQLIVQQDEQCQAKQIQVTDDVSQDVLDKISGLSQVDIFILVFLKPHIYFYISLTNLFPHSF